ncbi:MAG: glyoxalase [Blastocatellia bacterium AA13]|nr:MAG: glyoxalase [Blastocatellia bacterium AA13]
MGNVAHFAINADDLERARKFYGKVFGWQFEAWGPPGFYQIKAGDNQRPNPMGALQGRRELIAGQRTNCYECSIAVDSIDDTVAAVEAQGGKIVMPKVIIAGVGTLIFFQDTEGNIAGAMQYDQNIR